MLKLVNTKILLAILAALSALGGAVAYQRHETEKAAIAAAKARPFSSSNRRTPKNNAAARRRSGSRWNKTRSGTIPPQPKKARPGRTTFLKHHREGIAKWFP